MCETEYIKERFVVWRRGRIGKMMMISKNIYGSSVIVIISVVVVVVLLLVLLKKKRINKFLFFSASSSSSSTTTTSSFVSDSTNLNSSRYCTYFFLLQFHFTSYHTIP